jgi:hypothetical protein
MSIALLSTYSFLLHIDDQCSSLETAHTEEVHIFRPIELLRRLGRVGTLRR